MKPKQLALYKQATAAHIAFLQRQVVALEARAELAEREVRQIAAERNVWKFQAEEALAELKSRGAR